MAYRVFAIISIVFLSIACQAESALAWWLTYSLEPRNVYILNIPASKIDSNFEFISLLSCSSLKTFTEEQCLEIKNNNIALTFTGDFNSDKNPENWYVAVAKSKEAKYYSVLLATDINNNVIAVFKNSSKFPSFSGLTVKDNKLYWLKCMFCGDFEELEWRNARWALAVE